MKPNNKRCKLPIKAMVGKISYLGVSRHKAVHVVVDLLEDKAPVHEGEAALRREKEKTDWLLEFYSDV